MGYPSYDTFEDKLEALRESMLRDSEAWFPGVHVTESNFLLHSALGLAGETGEAVEVIKKWHRNFDAPISDIDQKKLGAECADVFIYLLHICSAAGINLAEAVGNKRAANVKRFGPRA